MNGTSLNEDNSHFFMTRADMPPTTEVVDAFVDQYAGTQVKHLLFCPNSMRTSYASRVWDPVWRNYDPDGPDDQPLLASTAPENREVPRKWIHTAWALDQAGIDVYARWIARARTHGISPWISMRMNDVHNVDEERSYIHSEFWREHPEFRRVTYRSTAFTSGQFTGYSDRAFDYGHKEVREYHFRLVEELAERYDFDGLELDWMRWGYYFRPGHEAEGAELLTEFTARARRLLDGWEKRRGHKIRLGARVPSRPQTALGLGMDAVTWARKGLIDWLVVTPFWESIEPDMPMELWRALLDGTQVELCAGLEVLLRPYSALPLFLSSSLEVVRGAALSLLHRGADRISLYNYFDSYARTANPECKVRVDEYAKLIREIGDPAAMASQPHRHVLTYSDTWAVGEPRASALPAVIGPAGWHEFRLHIGRRPTSGESSVVLMYDQPFGAKADAVTVRVNCYPCGNAEPTTMPQPIVEGPAWRYRVPLEALRDGYNVIEIAAKDGHVAGRCRACGTHGQIELVDPTPGVTINWVEMDWRPENAS